MPTTIAPPLANAASLLDELLHRRLGELAAPPVTFKPTVQGVPLSIPVSFFLSLAPAGSQIKIGARVVADLSDLQSKTGSLIDTIPLPTNPADHFGVDNFVVAIPEKSLAVEGNIATLSLKGNIDVWLYAQNPVQCSRVEWDEVHVFGGVIRVPRVVFYDCTINQPLGSQPFKASVPFSVAAVDSQTVAVQLGKPMIDLEGPLGGVTTGILQIAGVDLSSQAKALLDRALNPNLLQQTIPADLQPLHPSITKAELLSNTGALALYAEMTAWIDGTVIGQLIRKIFLG
jgi:hypothetical protein